ncbi:hypothetical protein KGQ20_10590 [Catenulispora sp. NF23]|uniref:DUF7711 domain-containing protein n=1 Tax=Catenulispora pinistramenti TaxID=2705254 RepID=A0ABS5KJR2_9ACTN|nr:hypothetical protein [Catenulispora pinistramenti]MBS2533221.1 hypothetical protein [Catenulispora pinistramenti]MBS2546578.1 hypothetical protein [Catenulispora pinistramenti]
MHHNTAVRRLRTIAEDCDKASSLLTGEDGLFAVYAFGPVLDHPGEDLDDVNVVLVMGLPAAELPWGVEPPGCTSLAHMLRLDKAPVLRLWRPAEWPVANHEIRRPMLIWSREDGVQTPALDALAERRAEPFRLADADDDVAAEQISRELKLSTAHLRAIRDRWDDIAWRRSHSRNGRYPEDHLWQAVDGFLDLLDASASTTRSLEDNR